ncbi:MAG: flagellar basal body P-ring formation protein FlgA [Proteobacteria bacterium]|nr:flagellar basal body P-ring formation protein FlgA [Pseudomonadota bacterium]
MKKFILLISIFTLGYCNLAQAKDIQQSIKFVTVKTMIKRGDMVNKSNLKHMDATQKNGTDKFVLDIDEADGLQALRHLRPGVPLRYIYLREKPLICKDKQIKIIYNRPGIKLESTVLALQDGQKGDIIKVKNIKTNKILTAAVIAENTVRVD